MADIGRIAASSNRAGTLEARQHAMRRRFFLIFNPTAGTSQRTAVERVVGAIRLSGGSVVWSNATTADAAREEARIAARGGAYDCVLAAGGDGTIRQAAIAVADTATPLGVIPLGTGNVLAHEIALPREPAAIAFALRQGGTVEIELARANGEPFMLMAGAGFDGRIIQSLDHNLKNRIAKLAYLPPALKTLTAPLDSLKLTIDGTPHEAIWTVVCNAERYAGNLRLAPQTHITKPGLVAVLFDTDKKAVLIGALSLLAMGGLELLARRGTAVRMVPCTHVEITAQSPVPCQIDGDCFGTTPLTVTQGGGRVTIVAPTSDQRIGLAG
jgi:diacylglycerol kinase (ATP)